MPRNKYPEQTVEKILDAAAALFAEKGYQSTTLQDIIDATGPARRSCRQYLRCPLQGTGSSAWAALCRT